MSVDTLPIRRDRFDAQGFLAYLSKHGCEIGKPSNPYEVVRYRAYWSSSKKPVTHIVYAKENGLLTWMQGSQAHYLAFLAGGPLTGNKPPYKASVETHTHEPEIFHGKPAVTSRKQTARQKIIARDGPDCWFCGVEMGDDCTIEHLIPKAKGGLNAIANYVAAHAKCNAAAADMPLVEKIALRAKLRGEMV